LSLHRALASPYPLDQPHLPPGWSAAVGAEGALAAPDGWRLVSRVLAVGQLPPGWRDCPWSACLDAERVIAPLLTTPAPGMRLAPLGMGGQHKLLGDFFTDRKVPLAARAGWPVVVDRSTGEVIWVCGHAVAHGPRITAETRQVLAMEWRQAAAAADTERSPATAPGWAQVARP
jgi:tRNA(Ile)-lysidine synthase